MTDQPPPPPGNYPPPPPPPGGYPPPPSGNVPPPGAYPYPPAPQGYPGGYPQGAAVRVLPREAYTSWFTRVLGALIDAIPPILLTGIAYGIAFATGETDCVESEYGVGGACSSSFNAVGTTALVLAWLASLAYWVWNWGYRQGTTGQSIGKSVMKFQVVSEKTWQPIGFGLSLVRQIAHVIDQIICYIGYLFPLWDAKRQTLADKIMSTVCVPVDQSANQQQYPQ